MEAPYLHNLHFEITSTNSLALIVDLYFIIKMDFAGYQNYDFDIDLQFLKNKKKGNLTLTFCSSQYVKNFQYSQN